MFIVDLQCSTGHGFEGWYDSVEDYHERLNNATITCPLCNSNQIERKPSVTSIVSKKAKIPNKAFSKLDEIKVPKGTKHVKALTDTPLSLEVQKAISRILQKVRQTHIDVGDEFAKRALAMSRNEEPLQPIIGQSSFEEEQRLDEEGVPYFKIPIPDIEKN